MHTVRSTSRQFPIGAEPSAEGTHFRVWAPRAGSVSIVFGPGELPPLELIAEGDGYHSGLAADAAPGMGYRIRLDGASAPWPDPASRFQPDGPRGPSQIVDAGEFVWHDGAWPGIALPGSVLYEMHIGTFTAAGTWDAAAAELAELAELGVTAIELMPVAEFPGRFGWSYDAANLFAPSHRYGTPDAVRRFVDEAHRVGLGVILDLVYNHLGAVGEALLEPFSEDYFCAGTRTNGAGRSTSTTFDSGPVREFFVANLQYWIAEYHLDGARIDATQAFFDDSPQHILLELARAGRAAAPDRQVLLVGESEPQQASLLRSADQGGCELDALWSDDFHHAAMVCLSGRSEAYYRDYDGTAEEFAAAAKWGYLYQGQRYSWQSGPRGSPALEIRPERFVHFLQNHDQVANSARGARIYEFSSPGRLRAMTALWLLMPETPLLFQGQEFASSAPFLYFNDSPPDEAEGVAAGCAKFLAQFPSYALPEIQAALPDPADPANFERCKLDFGERESHEEVYALHRDLLRLRRELAGHEPTRLEVATIGPQALVLRYYPFDMRTRLLVVNLGADIRRPSLAQPLLAPPAGAKWSLAWSSDAPRYGGSGTPALDTPEGWRIPGETAVLLVPKLPAPAE